MALALIVTPLLVILAVIVGIGVGMLFLRWSREPPPQVVLDRERSAARRAASQAAQKAVSEMMDRLAEHG